MEAGGSTSVESNRPSSKPFKIDHTSLLSNKSSSSNSSLRPKASSPSTTDSDPRNITSSTSPDWRYKGLANTAWERVGYLSGALGDRNGVGSDLYKPLDKELKIDRTQALMTPQGYSSRAGSSYRPLSREYNFDRTRPLSTGTATPHAASYRDVSQPRTGPRPSLTPTALTRSVSSEISPSSSAIKNGEEGSLQRGSLRSSHSSLIRSGSATPTGALKGEALPDKPKQEEERMTRSTTSTASRRSKKVSSSSSSSSSEEDEPPESPPLRKDFRTPISSSDRSGATTPYSTSSRTPVTSPPPRVVLDNPSPYDRKFHPPVQAETHQREPVKESPPLRKDFRTLISSSDRSGATTPYSSSSRTPVTSPQPRVVLDNPSPYDRKYHPPVQAETQQMEPVKKSAIQGLKTALDLSHRKNAEDKRTIGDLKGQLQACREEQDKEDPILKAALEDALRELRENKEVIAGLQKEIIELKKSNEKLKGYLKNYETDRSNVIGNYHSRVVALEEENILLKKEKDIMNERLEEISSKLDAQETELLKDKQQLETSIRDMQEKVSDSQKDKTRINKQENGRLQEIVALYAAIKTEDVEAIENLLTTPMDVDAVIAPDNSDRRAIHLAAENIKLASVVNQLLEAKADVNALDADNETALHIAARSGRGRIVKALLEAKADWTILNVEGWTALQVAAAVGNLSALEEFRKYDPVALRTKDGDGSTLLHYSCANSQRKATEWLVKHGSSKRRKNAFGLLAKDYKEAAKSDDSLLACFGSGGNRLAEEQLPRLLLESHDSLRRKRASSRASTVTKTLSEADQSSHASISEKHFVVSTETDTDAGHGHETAEEDQYPKSERETPVPAADAKSDITLSVKGSLKGKLSLGSDSGRSTVSLDTSSVATVHRPPKTPPPSEMPKVSLPHDESFSEDHLSDVSMISSQRSFKERLPTGLPNLGNTCYLNSIFQCLYYTKALSDNFINSRFRASINKKSPHRGAVTVAFGQVIKALRTGKETYASVKKMQEIASSCDSYYTDNEIKDPHYFVQHLLQWLHQDLSKDVSPDEDVSQCQVSLISTLFFGVHLNTIVCQESGTELDKTEEAFSTLSLPVEISGPTELHQVLTKRYRPQLILWACSECGKEHMCLKKQKILRLPSNLIIHFDRHEEITGNLMEAKNKMTYPQDGLSLADYLFEPHSDRGSYELYGVCNQKGHGITAHHTACCMTAHPPIWCHFNDLTVNPVATEEAVRQPDAFLLFYKMSVPPFMSTGV